ncbi:hypothetical protein [Leptospira licerasiae]|uniref:hypothetical protein n=1 Tax=Leptospira licerasiae TaxID=447106 RepID=UPI0030192748
MFYRSDDDSRVGKRGKIYFYSITKYLSDIVPGNRCFICGKTKNNQDFNDEHIIPNWLLSKMHIHSRKVTLPNGAKIPYGRYKTPCCRKCNSKLGKTYEERISKLFTTENFEEFRGKLNAHHKAFLFRWLNLLFFKTHYQDTKFKMKMDQPLDKSLIGDQYNWSDLHHIHCIVRSYYTKSKIDSQVEGTLLVFDVQLTAEDEVFDYYDDIASSCILIRLNSIGIVAVLNDSKMVDFFIKPVIDKISGKISPIQLREILAHCAFINNKIKYRPGYYSRFENDVNITIKVNLPVFYQLTEAGYSSQEFGKYLYSFTNNLLSPEQKLSIEGDIIDGRVSFLFNDGRFIKSD